ncbi:MAG: hypothetical protein AB1650_00440 [Candidatus Omnitrophota bacterium]
MKKFLLLAVCLVLSGCSSVERNQGTMAKYSVPDEEARWIQNGNPIDFEDRLWYPQDRFDVLLDSEVYYKGEYRGVPFFVEKVDIKPYNKIFTKFGRNKFRVYRPVNKNDQSL